MTREQADRLLKVVDECWTPGMVVSTTVLAQIRKAEKMLGVGLPLTPDTPEGTE